MDTTTAIFLTLAVLAVAMQLTRTWFRRKPATTYAPAGPLCTRGELAFMRTLELTLEPRYRIFAKVRLIDVIAPPANNFAAKARIIQKHLDFLICDRATTAPLCAIELNDKSHDSDHRKRRDSFVAEAMTQAGIPLVFIKAARTYSADQISATITAAIARASPATNP